MKNTTIRIAALAVLAWFAGIAGVQADEESKSAVASIEVHAARAYVAQHDDAVIMDVRTPAEFQMSHITGAINVDVQNDDFETMLANLDKDKTYLVHCTKNPQNGRSSRALQTMQGLGFKNLKSVEGGFIAWQEAELPLTEPAKEAGN